MLPMNFSLTLLDLCVWLYFSFIVSGTSYIFFWKLHFCL
jgi:hypothetical protein